MEFKYSTYFTLQPHDATQKKLYWKFKLKQIRQFIVLFSFVMVVATIFEILNFLIHLDLETFRHLIF